MKEKLTGALGTVGGIIYYVVACILLFMPLNVLKFPWWIDLICLAALIFTTYIASILELVLWVWSLVVVISQWPLDVFTIIYYIALVIYVVSGLIPKTCAFISNLLEWHRNRTF